MRKVHIPKAVMVGGTHPYAVAVNILNKNENQI